MIFASDSIQKTISSSGNLANTSFICKTHIAGHYAWAAAGMTSWTPTNAHGQRIDLQSTVDGILARNMTIADATDLLYEQVAREYPALRQHAINVGYDPRDAGIQLVEARFEGAAAHYSLMLFAQPLMRMDCPGANCTDGMFKLGTHDRIDGLVKNLAELQVLMKRYGTAGALRYLIAEQEKATPALVGGRISILRLDPSGRHWIDRGVCN